MAAKVVAIPSRFDRARTEAQHRATLELGATVVKSAGERLARVHALLNTASGSDPAPRRTALDEALKSLKAAYCDLTEVVDELSTYEV